MSAPVSSDQHTNPLGGDKRGLGTSWHSLIPPPTSIGSPQGEGIPREAALRLRESSLAHCRAAESFCRAAGSFCLPPGGFRGRSATFCGWEGGLRECSFPEYGRFVRFNRR